ncbi:MAG: hypothetical protein ACRDD7_12115 [Peptostreptococcaceae bacterium]
MAIYRSVHVAFWKDPKVLEEFTPEDKLFFLYLMTNPNTTQIGIYKITKKQIAFEMGYSLESVNSIMNRFIENHKLIAYNEKTREIAIKHWGRYNLTRGGKPVIDCIKSEIKEVKDKTLLSYISKYIKKEEIKILFDIANENISDNQNIKEHKNNKIKGDNNGRKYDSKYKSDEHKSTYQKQDDRAYDAPSDEQIQRAKQLLREV